MKDFKKTSILVIFVLAILGLYLLVVNNAKYGVDLLTRTNLSENDPTVIVSLEKIKKLTYLRTADFQSSAISSTDIIEFVLDNMTEEEYTKKVITPNKIHCEVTKSISFSTDDKKCNIAVIENDKIKEIQKKYFNMDTITEFPDISYHGYTCQNDSSKYYCLIENYQSTILDYSIFADAYQEKDEVVIHEYYLRIDLTDSKRCKEYFDTNYCDNYETQEKPSIETETIKKDGVLFEHIFKETENNYYLEQYHIVSNKK